MLLLVTVAVIAGASAAAASLGLRMERAGVERELAWTERQYAAAIASYAAATSGGQEGPRTIEALLLDDRQPGIVRHLRRAYPDPVTQRNDWRVFRDPSGRIAAVCRPLATVAPPSDDVRREPDDPCAPFSQQP